MARRSVGVDGGGGRFLEHLLVPSLDRAIPLPEVDAVALAVEQDLDLDVARALEQPLEDETVVVEGGLGLTPGGGELVGEAVGGADGAHALSAAAGRWLDQHREADPLGRRAKRGVRLVGVVVAGGGPGRRGAASSPGRGLVAHRPNGIRRRPDPADAGSITCSANRRSRRGTRSPGGARPLRLPGGSDDSLGIEEVDRVGAVRAGTTAGIPVAPWYV